MPYPEWKDTNVWRIIHKGEPVMYVNNHSKELVKTLLNSGEYLQRLQTHGDNTRWKDAP